MKRLKIAPRPAALLVREADDMGVVPYDELADGLYPDEAAYQIDNDRVAVSVDRQRLANGGGAVFTAWARWIDAKGRTRTDPHGQEVEIEVRHTANAERLAEMGADVVAAEMLRLVLGEATAIPWSDEMRANSSIREAIKLSCHSASPDPAALLAAPARRRSPRPRKAIDGVKP